MSAWILFIVAVSAAVVWSQWLERHPEPNYRSHEKPPVS
jgi:hypothetical protein